MASTALVKAAPVGKTADERIQLVSFSLEDEAYGVEVLGVREIIRMPEITKMPNTPSCVEGIINLRGKVIPIVNLRKRFDLPISQTDNRTRIMVMDNGSSLTGLVVDAVSEVIRIHSSEIQPPPPLFSGNVSQEFIAGVFNHMERLLIVMDVDQLFSQDERGDLTGV